jgi:uncharacterized protein YhaN
MMPVRISEINIQNLGPIEKILLKPGLFNLIYGRNEKGKTFIVEFIVRSLFRNAKEWNLRSPRGSGRITVEGLDGKTEFFSPSSIKKLEDHWDQSGSGLPPDFSKLLVVKGAEMELVRAEGGVDRSVLKSFLSGADFLDRIEGRISKTVQSTRVENRILKGPNQGEVKEKNQLEEQLKRIEDLFGQIDKGYSGGRRTLLADQKARIEQELEQLERAKRHQAFQMAESIKVLEKERKRINEEALKSLRQKLHHFQQKSAEIMRKHEQQLSAEKKSEHYEWLRSTRDEYRELVKQTAVRAKSLFLISSILVAAVSVVCIVLGRTVPALLTLGASMVLSLLYVRQLHEAAVQALNAEELNGLKKEFQIRIKQPLSGLSHIEELLQKLEADYSESRILKKQLADDTREVDALRQDIMAGFSDLQIEAKDLTSWNTSVRQMEEKIRTLSDEITDQSIRLAGLKVEPSEYISESSETAYDEKRYQELHKQANDIERDIEENARKLDSLKQLVCQQTDDKFTISWEALIQNLKNKREQVLAVYQDLHAEILGKIALMQVLESVRKSEDAKIEAGLNSPEIVGALQRITRRYKGLRMEGDALMIADPFHEFPVSDLSTGAQEQTLLALRIGFASKLLKQDRLFVILDDAFQYSDWERRRYMTDTATELAKSGWQIFYFTMDDHIRDLFDEKGKTFGKEYVRLELK